MCGDKKSECVAPQKKLTSLIKDMQIELLETNEKIHVLFDWFSLE